MAEYKEILINIGWTALVFLVLPLLIYIIKKGIDFLKCKVSAINNEVLSSFGIHVLEIIEQAVSAVEQEFVKPSKTDETWSAESGSEAKEKAVEIINNLLTDADKSQLEYMYGDVTEFISTKIEELCLKIKQVTK